MKKKFDRVFYLAVALCLFMVVWLANGCQSQGLLGMHWDDEWPVVTGAFLAGAADGSAELVKWDYQSFKKVFPDANDGWYNPEISWRNKYKGGNPDNGPAFFGSTNLLVGATDHYHLMRTMRNTFLTVSLGLAARVKSEPKKLLLRLLIYSLANRAGFHLTYTIPRWL